MLDTPQILQTSLQQTAILPIVCPRSEIQKVMGPGIQERMAAVRAARTVYRGDSSGLGGAWGEFKTWLADRKLRQADWLWEVYLTDPSTSPDPATWTTELNQPLLDDAG